MSYIVGQYNHTQDSVGDSGFIDLITTGTPARIAYQTDAGVSNLSSEFLFEDECIRVSPLVTSEYYYLKCKVKRLTSEQKIVIKLINYENNSSDGNIEQYLKFITIKGGSPDEWVDVELIFNPIFAFDCILFQLQRTLDDYRVMPRFPKIAYQEFGTINDIITTKVGTNIRMIKIGVQSHPGLMMCINGEEIHTSRSGIYELKDGVLPINFFSVVKAATENTTSLDDWLLQTGDDCLQIEHDLAEGIITVEDAIGRFEAIYSECFFNTSKTTIIDSFTLDYMYEE